jgi:peptide chain release factor 2
LKSKRNTRISRNEFKKSEGFFDVENKTRELARLEQIISSPKFWDDQEKAQTVLQQRSRIASDLELAGRQEASLRDLETLFELQDEGEEVGNEIEEVIAKLYAELGDMELRLLLDGEHDRANAIVTIHSGAGGTESQDWAEMLLRMYLRWCERKGFKTEIVDSLEGEEAGIKSVTFTAAGDYAYGYLNAESGVHRLVRISPYDANRRRHTSFSSVFVYPEVEDDIEIDIQDDDLRIDTYRSSGHGGQHINVTDSAVRITHLPTGTVAQCQNERSQHRNKDVAMKVLRAKLYKLEMEKRKEKMKEIEKGKKDIAWGSQIRSYVLHPYRLVKDHRTNIETGDTGKVLDGDIDDFIKSFLLKKRELGR